MPDKRELSDVRSRTHTYLTTSLLPFWLERIEDRQYGGFLTYYDRNGQPTDETTKFFLMQVRALYVLSAAHRAGYGQGRCAEIARRGAKFIADHFWDNENDGWIWIADREGRPTYCGKVGYGQCFGIYAFSEYFLATGDPLGRRCAERTYDAVCRHMADTRYGGFYELLQPDWRPERPGIYGGDRKSLDVHMHMMEALTSLYEMTKHSTHRRRLTEVIDLILLKMLDPKHGLGYIQFTMDFTPLPAILFAVEWGRDKERHDGKPRPLSHTSYGHNVEFAWLLLRAVDGLGQDRGPYAETIRKITDHCVAHGLDGEYGGVLVEGPMDGPTVLTEKQFWQQAEVLVGLLDAYILFGDEKYWVAFRNLHDFVFSRFISPAGEWYERTDRQGRVVDDALGHGFKSGYHTVRSMIEVLRRLEVISDRL